MKPNRPVTALLSVALLLAATAAGAQTLEKLVMPGRVVAAHADTEGECAACHGGESGRGEALDNLCIACHEDVGADRRDDSGFHGKFEAAAQSRCVVCHTDHEGRDADIVPDDAGLFDHDFSDFPLEGAHLSVACIDCHLPDEPHRDASAVCGNCHVDDDVHGTGLGTACGSCHGPVSWTRTSFDHDTVGYALTGAHGEVVCNDCHRGNAFSGTPTQCFSCHTVDDVHGGSNGIACQNCHSTASWGNLDFNHLTETGFALSDGHGGLNCKDCHSRADYKDGLNGACAGCHLSEDSHHGLNGEICGDCHVATTWTDSRFDHDETDFGLHDAHAELSCGACHKASVQTPLPEGCGGCHTLDDNHAGQLGDNCGSCHGEADWAADIAFDHDLSAFPLSGMHAAAACGACHQSARFHDAPVACIDCHADDDVHGGSLGTACDGCHTENEWPVAVFDHGEQTGFGLDGAHAGVTCNGCHRRDDDLAAVPSTCGGCHRADDIHNGSFGMQCGDCHDSSSFSAAIRQRSGR